jgi:hypothetical protein
MIAYRNRFQFAARNVPVILIYFLLHRNIYVVFLERKVRKCSANV